MFLAGCDWRLLCRLADLTEVLGSTGLLAACPAVCILLWEALLGSSSSTGSNGASSMNRRGAVAGLRPSAAVLLLKAAIASSREAGSIGALDKCEGAGAAIASDNRERNSSKVPQFSCCVQISYLPCCSSSTSCPSPFLCCASCWRLASEAAQTEQQQRVHWAACDSTGIQQQQTLLLNQHRAPRFQGRNHLSMLWQHMCATGATC